MRKTRRNCILSVMMLLTLGISTNTPAEMKHMITINVDQPTQSIHKFKFNPQQTLVKLVSTNHKSSQALIPWLRALVTSAARYKIVSGFEIDAKAAVHHQALVMISNLAAKSTFVSTKFRWQKPFDWRTLYYAERENHYLLTTVTGANAARQIETYPALAVSFASTKVPDIHVFTTPHHKNKNQFWQQFSFSSHTAKHPTIILLLQTQNQSRDYQAVVKNSLHTAGDYLFWVGGQNNQSFEPISLSAKRLTVWRNNHNKIHGVSYARDTSPSGLYLAMGTSQTAFQALERLITRTQYAATQHITYLGDAEDNVHTKGVLISLNNTFLVTSKKVYAPSKRITKSTIINLLIDNPSALTATQLAQNAVFQHLLKQADNMLFVDYSTGHDDVFYHVLTKLLPNKSLKITYNTHNIHSLKNFQTMQQFLPKLHVRLGSETKNILH